MADAQPVEHGARPFQLSRSNFQRQSVEPAQQNSLHHCQPCRLTAVLYHRADGVRAGMGRHARDLRAVQGDRTARPQTAGDALQQGRFAGGVGAEDRRDFARFGLERHTFEHGAFAVGERNVLHAQCHWYRLPRKTSAKKNGTPVSAVITPMGKIAPLTTDLLTAEAAQRMSAPHSDDSGR